MSDSTVPNGEGCSEKPIKKESDSSAVSYSQLASCSSGISLTIPLSVQAIPIR